LYATSPVSPPDIMYFYKIFWLVVELNLRPLNLKMKPHSIKDSN